MKPLHAFLFGAALLAGGCGDGGLSTAELSAAAQERVREQLQLSPEAALFTATFVAGEEEGDLVVCGSVRGQRADGTQVTPRRFIAATDPARWVRFERPRELGFSEYDFMAEWQHRCAGGAEQR